MKKYKFINTATGRTGADDGPSSGSALDVTVWVNKGGTDQTGVGNNAYTTITWSTELSDPGSDFASNALVVASGEEWDLSCCVTTSTALNNTPGKLAVFKDGSMYLLTDGNGSYASPITFTCRVTLTEAGSYTIRAFSNNGVPMTISGTAAETWLMARRRK